MSKKRMPWRHEGCDELVLEEKAGVIAATDKLLEINQKADRKYSVQLCGREFVVHPNVFSPVLFGDTSFFLKKIPHTFAQEDFLEVGSGAGVIAVMAALGGVRRVVAVDINPDAVANTEANAVLHGVGARVSCRLGDVFDPLEEHERFDTIFWNAPFSYVEREDLTPLERAVYDPKYHGLKRYLKEGKKHLKPGGKLLIGFSSSSGHTDVLLRLAHEHQWAVRLVAETAYNDFDGVPTWLELYEATQESEELVGSRE